MEFTSTLPPSNFGGSWNTTIWVPYSNFGSMEFTSTHPPSNFGGSWNTIPYSNSGSMEFSSTLPPPLECLRLGKRRKREERAIGSVELGAGRQSTERTTSLRQRECVLSSLLWLIIYSVTPSPPLLPAARSIEQTGAAFQGDYCPRSLFDGRKAVGNIECVVDVP